MRRVVGWVKKQSGISRKKKSRRTLKGLFQPPEVEGQSKWRKQSQLKERV